MKHITDAGENTALGYAAGVASINDHSQSGKLGLVLLEVRDAVFLFKL